MKTRTLLGWAAIAAPLLAPATAWAAFTGITTETGSNDRGIAVVNVYAGFDRLGDRPEDFMVLTQSRPGAGFGFGSLQSIPAAWALTPVSRQGDLFDPDFNGGDGRVLIAQLAITDGTGFEGSMLRQYMTGGMPAPTTVSFERTLPSPATLAALGVAGLFARRRRLRAMA